MNRTIYTFLFKSFFALLLVFSSNKSFAIPYIAITSGDFNSSSTWQGGQNPSGGSAGDNVFIQAGITVTITSDVNLPTINLIIESGGHLIVTAPGTATTISFNDLTMGSGSSDTDIDFGTGNVTFTVWGNLEGGMTSKITHAPALNKTQKLILKGLSNMLDIFYSDISGGGSSIVSYEGGDGQTVVPSSGYSTLIIGGSGSKKIAGQSFNAGDVTTVSKKLVLNKKIKLDANDLVFKGINDSLIYNDGTTVTGWIWTNGTGMLKHRNTEGIRTFPIGDALDIEVLMLSNIDNATGLESGARYNGSEPNVTIPNTGTGTWTINANNSFKATILLGDPVPANTFFASPSIVLSTTGSVNSWSSLSTFKVDPQARAYWSHNVSIKSGKNYVAFISCPPLKISPSTLPIAVKNVPYVYNSLVVSNGIAPYTLSSATSAPSGFSSSMLSSTNGTVQITANPVPAGNTNYIVGFQISDATGCTTPFSFSISAMDPISPNLYITPIAAKTYGDADFKLTAYSKNTATPITYTISPANACAQLKNGTTDIVEITCAGPVPNNTITVSASQTKDGIYKAETVTTSFFINKAQAQISIGNNAFLTNTTGTITSRKNSDGPLTFKQLTGTDVATLNNAQVTTAEATGTFSVAASIPGTNNYTSFDSIFTFSIYPKKQPPLAVNDSITIVMGQDTIINILANDFGMTDTINSTLTDIDMENSGTQKKFYSTSLGTFTIDPDGTLNIRPFDGFVGTDNIGYTVTDETGLTSAVAYLYITVKAPFKLAELKANEVMTPNSDGLNDALVIANTNIVSDNSLVIIDEAGNIIFEQNNYQNDWKGTNQKGNKLDAGVYFYTFTEKNTGRVLQNFLQISGY